MLWLSLLLAACSMGKAPKPTPAPPPRLGVVTGHVTYELSGPGRAHRPEESFTHTSPLACTVTSGVASVKTDAAGAYTLKLPEGHADLSFADCVKGCCYSPTTTLPAEIKAGESTIVDFTCRCSAK